MDAQQLGFRDDSFDTVAISLALCTVPDPVAALREAARVCRPDGRIVLLEHVRSPVWPIALLQRLWAPIQERTLGCDLLRTTIDTARGLGFMVESERERLFGVFRLAIARPPDLK
jgi:ubiquinone/menaquinone biosynthesis C-methylase UbiE